MSTASAVPETWELTGDHARRALADVGQGALVRQAFMRLRRADGFSHARSLAYTLALVLVEGIIGLVGLAAVLGNRKFGNLVATIVQDLVPGPAGETLTEAVRQAKEAATAGQWFGLVFGLLGALVTGTTMMGQVERALNRMYGVREDRPTVEKYARAFVLTLTAGTAIVGGLVMLAFGRSLARELDNATLQELWRLLRWPIGLLLLVAAIGLLFRWAPNRHQPGWSWMAFGSAISVVGVVVASIGLGLFFRWSTSFGDTYGPLAGVVALLLWAFLTSVTLLYGAAVAAELEAFRSHEDGAGR